jgi:hypothetical protein
MYKNVLISISLSGTIVAPPNVGPSCKKTSIDLNIWMKKTVVEIAKRSC